MSLEIRAASAAFVNVEPCLGVLAGPATRCSSALPRRKLAFIFRYGSSLGRRMPSREFRRYTYRHQRASHCATKLGACDGAPGKAAGRNGQVAPVGSTVVYAACARRALSQSARTIFIDDAARSSLGHRCLTATVRFSGTADSCRPLDHASRVAARTMKKHRQAVGFAQGHLRHNARRVIGRIARREHAVCRRDRQFSQGGNDASCAHTSLEGAATSPRAGVHRSCSTFGEGIDASPHRGIEGLCLDSDGRWVRRGGAGGSNSGTGPMVYVCSRRRQGEASALTPRCPPIMPRSACAFGGGGPRARYD
jgi:hypothetical protein